MTSRDPMKTEARSADARSAAKAFVADCVHALTPLGPVAARAMFGGYGLYLDGVMTGLIADGVLYLKVDEATLPSFRTAGSRPFVYHGKLGGRPISMSYETLSGIPGDRDLLLRMAPLALEAARRAVAAKPKRRPAAAKPK